MIKKIRCPKCKHSTTIAGNPEEIKEIECPNCGLKGKFTFPKEIEEVHVFKEIAERPLGISILTILQIIAIIISIIVLIVIPLYSYESINDIFGIPIIEILFVYSLFIIPIAVLLAYGLFTGREWARFASVLFNVTSIIASIIRFNLYGAIIPFFIIYYLNQPHVKKYFKTELGLNKNVKTFIIVGFAILLIFSGYTAFLLNPINLMNNMHSKMLDEMQGSESASVTVSGTNGRIKILLSKGGDNAPYVDQTGKNGFDIYINGTKVSHDNWNIDGYWDAGESIILTQNEGTDNLLPDVEYSVTVQIMGSTIYDTYITVLS
jgi:Zn ribbon nucleic-acid-binding protein